MAGLKYGLIGYPLGHSLSPFIHERLFSLSGISANYSLYEIEPENLRSKYDFLGELEAFNVTIPHKINIIPFCESLSSEAEVIGAVNCVYKKVGYNTDVYGFKKSVDLLGASLKSRVLILGFGGAGRMAAITALNEGASLTIAVRNPDKVDAEFKDYTVQTVQIESVQGDFDLIVNSTPIGMFPNSDTTPISFEKISAKYVMDMIFNPPKTQFLKIAEKSGAKIISGGEMLVWQAVRSHEIWHDGIYTEAETEKLISDLYNRLGDL